MGTRDKRPLSELPPNSGWVNLWRTRDDKWVSFVGRIADDGAVEYPSGGRSLHNTVTHWTPLDAEAQP